MRKVNRLKLATPLFMALGLLLAACGGGDGDAGGDDGRLGGTVEIDGSSTVFPISAAVAEEFRKVQPRVRVNVAVSGTGGGFKRFVTGETDISNASRPIKPSEADRAAANGIEFIKMRVGVDGLTVVTHPDNDFATCLTVDELRRVWEPGSAIDNWADVRVGFPDQSLELYGPDTDSGTFDYFTEVVVGEVQASRADYTASADDNVLVRGTSGDRNSLGYFGYAFFLENTDKLNAVSIDSGAGCVAPTAENIESGAYQPLARPLFIYVKRPSLAKAEVAEFVRFYMQRGAELAREVGYVAEADSVYADNLAKAGL